MELYKFREFNANNLTALSNKQLWFSNQDDFNDPFEGTYIIDNHIPKNILETFACKRKEGVSTESYRKMISELGLIEGEFTNSELFIKIAKHDLNLIIDTIHDSKIACLSLSEPDNDPVVSNLMWSHYADGLRGFCLVFNDELLQQNIRSSSNKTMQPIKIKYQDKPNTLKLLDFIDCERTLGSDEYINFVRSVTDTIATKSTEWAYENETRILTLDKSNFHYYSENSLIQVIVGDKMPRAQRKLLLDTIKLIHPNATVKKARLMDDSYSVEIVPL